MTVLLHKATESEFQALVIQYAKLKGWMVHHDRRQDLSVGGDPGFPDLVLAREGRVVFIELKVEKAKPTAEQEKWLTELDSREGTHDVYWFRPSNFERIKEVLA